MHLLEAGTQVLLDCGLYQGRREEARRRNAEFPFAPRRSPPSSSQPRPHRPLRQPARASSATGSTGPIYSTPATRDLSAVMLVDSAKIQEEDAAHLNIPRNYAEPWVEPLYTPADVDRVLAQVVPVDVRPVARGRPRACGSSSWRPGTSSARRWSTCVTGRARQHADVHRRPGPAEPAAAQPTGPDPAGRRARLREHLREPDRTSRSTRRGGSCTRRSTRTIDRGGKVLIPAFSLGRTQLIIHFIHKGMLDGHIPRIPVYVDSPLAADIAGRVRGPPGMPGRRGQADARGRARASWAGTW